MRIQGLYFLNQQIHSWVPVSVCLSVLTLTVLIFLGNSLEGHLEAVDGPSVVCLWDVFNAIEVNALCSFMMTTN